jgi:undecaprenyl-diphosphatase
VPLWQAIILGAVQGLTEFLPISSTAHLALIPWVFGWRDPGLTFDVALHVGTLVAVLIYFWRTWMELFAACLRDRLGRRGTENAESSENPLEVERAEPAEPAEHSEGKQIANEPVRGGAGAGEPLPAGARLLWLLVLGTIPAGVIGLLLEKHVETTLRSPWVMGTMLITVGLLMAYADKLKAGTKTLRSLRLADVLAVGFAQASALIPGVSRSGITITAGLFMHFQRDTAARFSFLLSTPIIAGACLKKLMDVQKTGLPPEMLAPFAAGAVASAIVGYATIAFFLKFLQFGTFRIFVYYRVIIGIIVLALAMFYQLTLTP